MANEWVEINLGDVVQIMYGKDHKHLQNGLIPVYGSGGIMRYADCSLFDDESILIPRKGTLNNIIYVNKPFWTVDTMFWTKINKLKAYPKFLFYQLKLIDFTELNVGSAVPSLTVPVLNNISLFLPPLPVQQRIADILGALDDKIELNRKQNETLEAMARALFKAWFVDFEPVRAKQDGRWQRGQSLPGLPAHLYDLFPDQLVDSELGEIPQGWGVKSLGESIGFLSGFSFKSQDWQENGVPVVKIGSVKPGIIDLAQVSYVSEEIAQQVARYRLSTGDMLIGMTGYVGEVGLVPPSNNPPLLNQRVGKFVMTTLGTESLAFWYCMTRSPEFKDFVKAQSHGTAQANVSSESIMSFPFVAPPHKILDIFNCDCKTLLDRILSSYGQSRTLTALRDTLLPKLLSGELAV